eukprot:15365465-Ditylum_brightwellii.AAC.1
MSLIVGAVLAKDLCAHRPSTEYIAMLVMKRMSCNGNRTGRKRGRRRLEKTFSEFQKMMEAGGSRKNHPLHCISADVAPKWNRPKDETSFDLKAIKKEFFCLLAEKKEAQDEHTFCVGTNDNESNFVYLLVASFDTKAIEKVS